MKVIRYSQGFKLKLVREAEEEGNYPHRVSRKYRLRPHTVMRWVRQYGSGKHGKVIRVEKPEEKSELKRLRERVRRLESALADANIDLALERAYTEIACQEAGVTVEEFKKNAIGKPRINP